jgi:YggT family protein
MNLNPFINVIGLCLDLYRWALLVWIVLSLLVSFQIINSYQPLVRRTREVLEQLIEPVLGRIRRIMPHLRGLDLSPLVLLIVLGFLKEALHAYFYNFTI